MMKKIDVAWTRFEPLNSPNLSENIVWGKDYLCMIVHFVRDGGGVCALIHPDDADGRGVQPASPVSKDVFMKEPRRYGVAIYEQNGKLIFE